MRERLHWLFSSGRSEKRRDSLIEAKLFHMCH